MKKVSKLIVKGRYILTAIFVVLVVISAIAANKVVINYDMLKYLDEDSQSTVALNKMNEEFGAMGQITIMLSDIDKDEANKVYSQLEEVSGVSAVIFDSENENCYKDNKALYQLYLSNGDFSDESYEACDTVKDMLSSYNLSMYGTCVLSKYISSTVMGDMSKILLIACFVVFLILLLTSTSWIDPIIFSIIVAGSIIMNLGSNIWMGEISFITEAICAVMQLALAMDYSIILLNSYNSKKLLYSDNKEAMAKAIYSSFKPVSSSSITTIAGLIALVFMSFSIGFDIGMVLAKGILLSLLSVFLFMPGFLIVFDKLIVKTTHRSIFVVLAEKRNKNVATKLKMGKKVHTIQNFQYKTRIAMPIIAAAIIVGGAILNFQQTFSYALKSSSDDNAQIVLDQKAIESEFGIQNNTVILIPDGDIARQAEINEYMKNYTVDGVKVVNSSQSMVESGAYSKYTASEISNMFSVPESDVQAIFSEMNAEDEVMLYDLITYIYENKTISTTANALQTKINTEYSDNAYLFEDMTASELASKLGYSEDIVSMIYDNMNCTSAKPYEVINYIVDNNTIEDICDSYQQIIDTNYTKTAPLRSDSTLVTEAQTFVLLYENTTAEEFKSAFTESYNNASIALSTNSYSEVQSQYKFITDTVLDNIYASYGLNKDSDEIANYQLLKALSDNNVATLYGEGLQSYIDSLNTEDYQNSDEGKTELTYSQVLGAYTFVSSDTLDSIYTSYGLDKNTDTITSYQLIKALSESNVAETYFSNVQTYINSQNENSEILFSDSKKYEAETLISRYSETATDFKAAYESEYSEYKAAITEYTYQQVLNTYQFLTSEDLTQIYENLNLDINNDTIAAYQLLAPLSEDNMAHEFGKSQQRSIFFKQALMSVLFTEMSKADIEDQYAISSVYIDKMFSDLNSTDSLEVHDILKYIVDNNLITEIGTDKEAMVTDAMNRIQSGEAMFCQNGYTMLVYNLNMEFSSQEAFDAVSEIKTKINTIYDENYIISASSTYSDIQTVYNKDIVKVSLISVIAILVICSITFSSVFTAALITLLIQGSIWISMGINTLAGYEPFFVCYLVVMCIQMGATVDYGILISTKYIAYRKTMDKHLAITKSLNNAFPTVLTSGSILVIAAGIVGIASSASVISEIGWQLARGCLISIIMVLLVLPQILLSFDKWIEKTTLKTTFYHGVGRMPKVANATNNVINDAIKVTAEDVETISTDSVDASAKK